MTKISHCFRVYSVPIAQSLFRHGCIDRKTGKLVMPNINSKFYPNFILGYIDGNGTLGLYYYRQNTSFSLSISGSPKLLSDMKIIIDNKFKTLGYLNKITHHGTVQTLKYQNKHITIQILDWLYGDSQESARMNRKYNYYLYMKYVYENYILKVPF